MKAKKTVIRVPNAFPVHVPDDPDGVVIRPPGYKAPWNRTAEYRELLRLRSAIEWALGMGKDGFRPREPEEGPFWWRTELRERALGKTKP